MISTTKYELSNHLGNVMSVISDRKIARDINQDNTVDYYEPDVLLTYDYSPFGAPLHARSFSKEVCHDTTFTMVVEDLNTDFDDGTTQGWSVIGSAALSVSSGQLKIVKNGGGPVSLGMGATNSFVATSGNVYNFTIDKGSCNPSSNILLQLLDANNTVIYTQTLTSGSQTYSTQFTANTTGVYTIRVTRINNASKCYFFIDDVLVTHEEEVSELVCTDYGDYKWGWQGYMKNNEWRGSKGTDYDFEGYGYDPLTGRRKGQDPAHKEYPSISPYSGFANNPLIFTDPDGKRIYFVPGLGYDASKGDKNSPYVTGIPNSLEPYLKAHETFSKTIQGSKGGRLMDMLYVAWRGQRPRINVSNDKRAMMIAYSIAADLNANPLKEDEQMNILATSQGTVSSAHAAIALLEDPMKFGLDADFTIDNLVLAGSPIDPKSKLYKRLESLKEAGKIKNIEYENYQAEGDMVTGLAGKSKGGALIRGVGYVGRIVQAVVQSIRGKELTDPHVRAAYNKSIDKKSGKETFGEELQQKLEDDEIH